MSRNVACRSRAMRASVTFPPCRTCRTCTSCDRGVGVTTMGRECRGDSLWWRRGWWWEGRYSHEVFLMIRGQGRWAGMGSGGRRGRRGAIRGRRIRGRGHRFVVSLREQERIWRRVMGKERGCQGWSQVRRMIRLRTRRRCMMMRLTILTSFLAVSGTD